MSWGLIDEHRKKARLIAFRVLVWGPSEQDAIGYRLRSAIKGHLISKGHSAKFSEELVTEGALPPAPDPIIDEVFHADAADLIVVLYRSRGTQTETDVILADAHFAAKSIVIFDEPSWERLMNGLSAERWRDFRGRVLKFSESQYNETDICDALGDLIERLQFAVYYRNLKAGRE